MTSDLQNPLPLAAPVQAPAKTVVGGQERGKVVPPSEAPATGIAALLEPDSRAASLPTESEEEAEAVQPDLSNVVESINDFLQATQRDLTFSYDEEAGRSIITVLDRNSQEIIRIIPPKEVLAVAALFREQGVLNSVGIRDKA